MVLRSTLLIMSALMGPSPERQIPQPICYYTIEISEAVPVRNRQNLVTWVNSAVAIWKSKAPGAARFAFTSGQNSDLVFRLGPERIDNDDMVLGYCDNRLLKSAPLRIGTISVITEWGHWSGKHNPMTKEMIRAVTMHELGHFLGLGHNHTGVMRMFDPSDLPTEPDKSEVAEVKAKT